METVLLLAGNAGAQTFALAEYEAQSSLLYNRLHPQIQILNACPDWKKPAIINKCISFHFLSDYSYIFLMFYDADKIEGSIRLSIWT